THQPGCVVAEAGIDPEDARRVAVEDQEREHGEHDRDGVEPHEDVHDPEGDRVGDRKETRERRAEPKGARRLEDHLEGFANSHRHAPPRGARSEVPMIALSIRPSAVRRTECGGPAPSSACAFRRKKRTETMRAAGTYREDATDAGACRISRHASDVPRLRSCASMSEDPLAGELGRCAL